MSSNTAIIATGGKQYRVAPGDVIDVELLDGEAGNGDEIKFDQVLFVSGQDGAKMGDDLSGATVTGVLQGEVKGPKIRVFKHKRRKGYRRTNGHRQKYHRVRIDAIDV